MAYADLREFIAALERAGELKRIRASLSPLLEIPEVADRVVKRSGPALLFEQPEGYPNRPLLINQFGTARRMAMALGVENVDEIAGRLRGYLEMRPAEGLLGKLKMLPQLAEMGAFFPRTVSRGPCQQVIREKDFSLLEFPVLQCWPEDAGRFITLPCVFTRDPLTGRRNVGMYRLQVFDQTTCGMHWQIHKHGAEHQREALRQNPGAVLHLGRDHALGADALPPVPPGGQRLPVAAAIGTDPAVTFAAVLPAPPGLDEMLLAGFLRQQPVEMVRCHTVDLEVPAGAEIVLEGYVDLDERRLEGPFGDHTGFYSLADQYPVLHVTCITHRQDPIYATTIVGKPPMEDGFMGQAIGRIFLPLLQLQLPEVTDIHMPLEGCFHHLMIVAVKKSYPGQARKVMHGLWGLGQAMFTKCIIVVDHDVDIHDPRAVVLHACNNIDPERDIQFTLGPIDALDHASRLPNYGSKMGIDATRKWPSEGFARPWPAEMIMDPQTRAKIDALWSSLQL